MLKIVRWEGGYAGDSIMSSILSVNKKLKSNVSYIGLMQNGRASVPTDKDHILSSLACIHKFDNINDHSILDNIIQDAIHDKQMHLVRMLSYDPFFDKYRDYITDIVSTNDFLSFTTSANFYKTGEITKNFLRNTNKFYRMLEQQDSNEAVNYMIYCIAVSHYKHNSTKPQSNTQILLDNWINLKYNKILGYDFDRDIHNQWIHKNQYILDRSNLKIEKICDLVKREIPFSKIRKLL